MYRSAKVDSSLHSVIFSLGLSSAFAVKDSAAIDSAAIDSAKINFFIFHSYFKCLSGSVELCILILSSTLINAAKYITG